MNFEIDKKQIEIFYNETENKKIPVIILNTFSGEGNKVWEECKKLNAKDYLEAADQFLRWNKAGGKVLNGLTRRRNAEAELYFK